MESSVEDIDGKLVPKRSSDAVPARDKYVVCREPVAEVVQSFISRWNQTHAPDNGRFAPNQRRTEITQVRAIEWISEETRQLDTVYARGVSEKTLQSLFRRRGPDAQMYKTIDLRTADLLLTAVGRNDLIDGGDPRLTPQRRSSRTCCTGSLTGTVTPDPVGHALGLLHDIYTR